MKLRHIVTVAIGAFLFSTFAQAQTQKGTEPTTIRASAEGTANAIADQADVVINIQVEANSSQNAVEKGRDEFDRIVAVFRKHLGDHVKFDAPELRVSGPGYGTNARQFVQGQFAVHLTSVNGAVTTNLTDAISEANIQQPWITYKSSQEEKARNEAARQATIKARERAEAMASALGMKVVRVVSIDDTVPMYVSRSSPMLPIAGGVGIPGGVPTQGKGTGGGDYGSSLPVAPLASDGPGRPKTPTATPNQLNPLGNGAPVSTTTSGIVDPHREITVTTIVTIVVEVGK